MINKTYAQCIINAPKGTFSCTLISDASQLTEHSVSHDHVSRFLQSGKTTRRDVWLSIRDHVQLDKGYLIIDDTFIKKPYMKDNEIIGKHCVSNGSYSQAANVIYLAWTDGRKTLIIDAAYYQKKNEKEEEHSGEEQVFKDKNELMRDLLDYARNLGFTGITVLMDSWYSGNDNLHHIKKLGYEYVTRVKKNRVVIIQGEKYSAKELKGVYIPEVNLKNLQHSVSILVTGNGIALVSSKRLPRKKITSTYARRWLIECLFKNLKQYYHLEDQQGRLKNVWYSHLYLVSIAYHHYEKHGINHAHKDTQSRIKLISTALKTEH